MASNKIESMDAVEAARNALVVTKGATAGESVIIFCDPEKRDLGEMYADAGISLGLWTRLVILKAGEDVRTEPDDWTKEIIVSSRPELIVNVFRSKGGETAYRIQFMRLERRKTDRIVHCPGISMDMFTEGAAALTEEGYEEMFAFGNRLKDALKDVHKVHVTCARGSDFTLDLGGKEF